MNQLRYPAAHMAALASTSQYDRLLRMDFPRNDGPTGNVMVVKPFHGTEEQSRDFRYTVEVLSNDTNIRLTAMMSKMGKTVAITLVRDNRTLRYFNGYVLSFRYVRTDGGLAFYEMELRPCLAFLEPRHDCAMFRRTTLGEITQKTFEHCLTRDYRFHLADFGPDITLTVQYNESDYNHLHRRWEAAGLLYWHEHRRDGHTLVLSDDSTLAQSVDDDAFIGCQSKAGARESDGIRMWSPSRRVAPALYIVHTYEFKTARSGWADRLSLNVQGNVPALERHEYTSAYGFNRKNGEKLAQRRMEQIDGAAQEFHTESNHRAVQPGRTFGPTKHIRLPRRPAVCGWTCRRG